MIGIQWHVLYLGFSAFYLLSLHFRPYPFDYIIKAMPIFLLMAAAWQFHQGNIRRWLLLALGFSATGDILLALTFSQSLVSGIGAFLIAQCCYFALFIRYRQWQNWKAFPVILVLVFAVTMARILLPELDQMQVPVLAYLIVISLMSLACILALRNNKTMLWGALTFLCSDTLIAWNLFIQPVPYESYWIMTTYYLAQYLLVNGISSWTREIHEAA